MTDEKPVDDFKPEFIGQWSEPAEFVVERERTIAYAAATNDPIKRHIEGDYASPLFAVVPVFQQLAANHVPGAAAPAAAGCARRRGHWPVPPMW